MKMGDRVRFGSDAEVIGGFRDLASQFSLVGSTFPLRDKSDYFGFALGHLATYASTQLIRMASLYQAGIEVHAWGARNLFEVCLLCEYVVADPPKAQEFVSQEGVRRTSNQRRIH